MKTKWGIQQVASCAAVALFAQAFLSVGRADESVSELHVGARSIVVADNEWGGPFPVLVMYPTTFSPSTVEIGPYTLDVAWEGPVAEGPHRLVLISHGRAGTYLGYRSIALRLARNGYVVLMPEHPGDNKNDDSLTDTRRNLENRPRHVSLAVDAVSRHAAFERAVSPGEFSVIGHSMGGYTALAAAGGMPSAAPGDAVSVRHDERVSRLVLMAPATPWFQGEGALARVNAPILMLSGARDEITPLWHADVVLRGLPESTLVEHEIIAGAGHFSFMSPFPADLEHPSFAPSQDPPGFDRVSFQTELGTRVLAFLDTPR